jgi:hypothetical protein
MASHVSSSNWNALADHSSLALAAARTRLPLTFRTPRKRRMMQPQVEVCSECADMTNQSIATALPLGFLAFTLSVLPVTTAEAECYWAAQCREGDLETGRVTRFGTGILGGKELRSECCTTPSEPYATGETESERQKRFARECAEQGIASSLRISGSMGAEPRRGSETHGAVNSPDRPAS